MIYHGYRCVGILGTHSEEEFPQSLEIHSCIEKYINSSHGTAESAYA